MWAKEDCEDSSYLQSLAFFWISISEGCVPDSPEDLHTAADPRKHAGGTPAEQHLAPRGAMAETAKRVQSARRGVQTKSLGVHTGDSYESAFCGMLSPWG